MWSVTIDRLFQSVKEDTTQEDKWYGPYNALLNHMFPSNEGYAVSPRLYGYPDRREGGFDFTYVVELRQHPVFFLEIKCQGNLFNDLTRLQADNQMRFVVTSLRHELIIPKLYGINVMGTTFTVYEYDKATTELTPHSIPKAPKLMNDLAPIERWSYNFLQPQGEERFREIVAHIKAMCEAL